MINWKKLFRELSTFSHCVKGLAIVVVAFENKVPMYLGGSIGLPALIVVPMTRDISISKWSESQTESRYILLFRSQHTGISYVLTIFSGGGGGG